MPKWHRNYVYALYSKYFMHDLMCNNISQPVNDPPTIPSPQNLVVATPLPTRIDAPGWHISEAKTKVFWTEFTPQADGYGTPVTTDCVRRKILAVEENNLTTLTVMKPI